MSSKPSGGSAVFLSQNHLASGDWNAYIIENASGDANQSGVWQPPIDMVFNDGHRLSIAVYSFLMIVGTLGNATILKLLVARRLKHPSRVDVMLMHLAMADLMVTLILMPLEIGWAWTVSWRAGDTMCRLMMFFRTYGLYLSSFVLVCISVDRYLAVMRPMNLSGIDTRSRLMLVAAYLLSMVCSIPQALLFHVERHPIQRDYEQCVTLNVFKTEDQILMYTMFGLVMMYALPMVVIVFCYASIYAELYRRSKTTIMGIASDRFRRSSDDVLSRAKKKTLWMTVTIVIVFVVCWTPYNVICFWFWLDKDTLLKTDQRVQKLLYLFACTNSCMNPIVYGLYNIPRRQQAKGGHGGGGHMSLRTLANKHSIIENRRSSIQSTRTSNSVQRTICTRCGEVLDKPMMKSHSLYHD